MLSHLRNTKLPQVNKQKNDACPNPTSFASMLHVKVDLSPGKRIRKDARLSRKGHSCDIRGSNRTEVCGLRRACPYTKRFGKC